MSNLTKEWRALRYGTPGRRFYDFHHIRTERRGEGWPPERVLTIGLAILLVAFGAVIGWLPGPGGFVALIGIALLAAESLRVSKLLDRLETRIRSTWAFLRARVFARRGSEDV